MSHHYIRHNYGDNCYYPDNSFKRFNRYNDSHGDTLIFNYNYGGCGGGFGFCAGNTFWSGLGMGLANGLMGVFGGIMGGFGNMFGGWGMPMFNAGYSFGMTPSYGINTAGTVSSSGSSSSSKKSGSDCIDADEANISTLISKFETLKTKENPTAEEVRELYNTVKSYYKNPIDDAHSSGNKKTYGLLMGRIEELAASKKINLDGSGDVQPQDTPAPEITPTPAPTPAPKQVPEVKETEADKMVAKINAGVTDAVINDTLRLLPKLNETDQKAVIDALKANGYNVTCDGNIYYIQKATSADDDANEAAELETLCNRILNITPNRLSEVDGNDIVNSINKLADLDTENAKKARAKLKAVFYKAGNTNVTANELAEAVKPENLAATKAAFKNIEDISENIGDFKNVSVTSFDGKTLKCDYTNASGKVYHLTYTFVGDVDGELIFHGLHDNQHYVLQKNGSGEYELVQYKYHSGYDSPDVTSRPAKRQAAPAVSQTPAPVPTPAPATEANAQQMADTPEKVEVTLHKPDGTEFTAEINPQIICATPAETLRQYTGTDRANIIIALCENFPDDNQLEVAISKIKNPERY